MQYVYLLQCNDGSTYTGCTQNIDERLRRHALGEILYTSSRLPVVVVTYVAFNDKNLAFKFEKYLKSGSGKAFSNKRFLGKVKCNLGQKHPLQDYVWLES
jgi:putative endonuclease